MSDELPRVVEKRRCIAWMVAGTVVLSGGLLLGLLYSLGNRVVSTPAPDAPIHKIRGLLEQYARDHHGAYPEGKSSTEIFQKLLDEKYATDASLFFGAGGWIPAPLGKKPAISNHLLPENVCFDLTVPVDSNTPDGLPLVFSTGFRIEYMPGGSAIALFPLSVARDARIEFALKNEFNGGMTGNNTPGIDPVIRGFIPAEIRDVGKYRQVTPDGPPPR